MKETQQGNLLRPTQPLGVSEINYPRSLLTYSSTQGKWLPRSLNIEYLQLCQNFANVTKVSSSKLILFVSERVYLNVFLFRFKSVQIVTGIYLHMLYFRCIWLLALKIANFVQNKMCTAVFNNICCKERKGLKFRQLSNSAIIFSQLQKTCGANIIWVFESTTSN